MKIAPVVLCAAALVVAVQSYYVDWNDAELHEIHKREVNCDDPRQLDGPRRLFKCCRKLGEVLGGGGGPRDRGSHERRGGPGRDGGRRHSSSESSSEEDGPRPGRGGHGQRGGPGDQGPPPRRPPPHRGHRPPGPPPPRDGPGGDFDIRCHVEEEYTNRSFISNGKVNAAAIESQITTSPASSWDNATVHTIIQNCTVKAGEMLAHSNATNCTSGAFEFQMCLQKELFLSCPEGIWKNSDKCNAAKEYVRQCPLRPRPPLPPGSSDEDDSQPGDGNQQGGGGQPQP